MDWLKNQAIKRTWRVRMQEEGSQAKKGFNIMPLVLAVAAAAFVAFIITSPGGDGLGPVASEGQPAPVFELKDLTGKTWRLEDLKGTAVVVNFWATWCQPCRTEMPSLNRLLEKTMSREDFVIVTVLYRDSPENAKGYMAENGFNLPVLIDSKGKTAARYGLTGVPETFFINKQGVLVKKIIGPAEFDSQDALKYIEGLVRS